MSRRWKTIVSVAAAFGSGLLVAAMATGGQPEGGEDGLQAPGAIGPRHAELTGLVGEYTTESKLTISEGSDAFESTGTAKVTSILDGRFIAIEETGELLGAPYKSQKFWGFNGSAGRYESVWLFSGSTAMTTLVGKAEASGKPIRLEGSVEEAVGKTKYAAELSLVDAKSFRIVQVALNTDGSSGAKVETVFTRK